MSRQLAGVRNRILMLRKAVQSLTWDLKDGGGDSEALTQSQTEQDNSLKTFQLKQGVVSVGKRSLENTSSKNVVLPILEAVKALDSLTIITEAPKSQFERFKEYWTSLAGWFNEIPPILIQQDTRDDFSLKSLDKIKKIVVIGVHGWFPLKIFNRVLGDPIGTSQLFGAKMERAIHEYFNLKGEGMDWNSREIELTMLPIDCEGRILERVESLYTQILKSKEKLSSADLIVFSAHSQGCPVSTLLLARLLGERVIDPSRQRTGILAMAGISHGPFPHLKQSVIIKYVESEPATELFEFNNPNSEITKQYFNAMAVILDAGTKYCAVGSWYDQVVPLYSATVQGVNHPNLYRALYIDAQDYLPDFLSHLLVFSLKLRNSGYGDYGLVVHLSDLLAGSIYGFGTQGHSAVYEENQTYALGIAWIMAEHIQTNNWKGERRIEGIIAPHKINPYYLPWILARLMMDNEIQADEELSKELEQLRVLFIGWNPSASALKDLKYRLDPIKSKL